MVRYLWLNMVVAVALQPVASIASAQESTTSPNRASAAQGEAKPLVDIVKSLEEADYGPIVEVDFDDGVWEVEAFKGDIAYELAIDPQSGEVLSEHRDEADAKPPAKAKSLSEILTALDKAGYTDVDDISFDHRTWEIEVRREGMKRELRVDPLSGEVVSDRVDD